MYIFNSRIEVRSRDSGNPSIAANYNSWFFNVYLRIPLERELKCGKGIPEKLPLPRISILWFFHGKNAHVYSLQSLHKVRKGSSSVAKASTWGVGERTARRTIK